MSGPREETAGGTICMPRTLWMSETLLAPESRVCSGGPHCPLQVPRATESGCAKQDTICRCVHASCLPPRTLVSSQWVFEYLGILREDHVWEVGGGGPGEPGTSERAVMSADLFYVPQNQTSLHGYKCKETI